MYLCWVNQGDIGLPIPTEFPPTTWVRSSKVATYTKHRKVKKLFFTFYDDVAKFRRLAHQRSKLIQMQRREVSSEALRCCPKGNLLKHLRVAVG